jgi:hypothetical protein
MRFFTKIILLVLLLGITLFAKSVATVTALNGEAFLKRDAQKSMLNLGDKLVQKDSIITGAKAKVQIIFEDETVVTVGRNSEFFVDEYLFEDSQDSVAKFGMFKGAMRAITGKIGKIAPQKFSVKTKTATIGIRGTNFTIVDADDGSSAIYCTYGAIGITFNGVESVVRQGFYLYISVRGVTEVREFSAKELSDMRKKSFGKSKNKKTKSDKDSEVISENEDQMDTTKEPSTSDVVVKDISDKSQDASHTETPSCSKHGSFTPYFAGYVTGNILPDTQDYVTYIENSPQNSYVLLNNIKNINDKVDSWKLYFDSHLISYDSKEKFKVGFSSAEAFPGNPDSTTSNPIIKAGIFEATGDDLLDGDYMSWGTWNATIDYQYEDPYEGEGTATHMIDGLWVAGEPTDPSFVEALNGESSYLGIYRAKNMAEDGAIVNGMASMHVDFGNDTASLYLDFDAANGGRNFDMSILAHGRMSGSQTDGSSETGTANGTFYGPTASEIGGNFHTTYQGGQDELKGVYQVQIEQHVK